MFALVDDDTKEHVINAIRKAGGTPYTTTVGVQGVRVE